MTNLFEADLQDITRLILVRHGKTKANKEARIGSLADIAINKEGEEQAEKLADRLKTMRPDVLYTSPLLRTRQTAQYIANATRLAPINDKDLREFDFGLIANKKMSDVEAELPEFHKKMVDWLNNPQGPTVNRPSVPGGETIMSFYDRIERFSKKILEKHPSKIVVAVMHMATIKGFMSYHFGPPMEGHMNFNAFNASINIIDFFKGMPVLTAFNDICHLQGEYTFGRVNLL